MSSSKKSGRKTKLTPELIERICEYIRKGNYISTACKAVGIAESTYYSWVEQAESGKSGLYPQFLQEIIKAEAQAEQEMIEVVRNVAITDKNWLAAMTFLERKYPDRWGRRERTKIDINERKAITITHVEVVLNQGEGAPPMIEGESRLIPEPKTSQSGRSK